MNHASRVLVVLACLWLLAGAATAQEEKKAPDFWSALRARIEALVPVKQPGETTAVGGVRGAKNGDAEGLYWKGDQQSPVVVSEAEALAFRQAMDLVAAGTRAEALARFEQFLVTYPESGMRKDAVAAIEELKAGR